MTKINRTHLIVISAVILAVAGYFVLSKNDNELIPSNNSGTASSTVNAGWEIYMSEDGRAAFEYPKAVGTNYIHPVEWPPKLQVVNQPYSCREAGQVGSQAGKTEEHNINGRVYCVTRIIEGAAGSMYTEYAYAFPKATSTAILTFTIQQVQCANYPEPEMSACLADQGNFVIGEIIDDITQTLEIVS